MDDALLDLLRHDLEAAGYSAGAVGALWGAAAEGARGRGVFAPARLALNARPTTPSATLGRVLLLGDAVAIAELDAALPGLGSQGALALGLVTVEDGLARAALSVNPVSLPDPVAVSPGDTVDWWIVSDLDDGLRRGPARPDHVMGVGRATRSLLAQAPFGHAVTWLPTEPDAAASLDLGTGCGIVAMILARARQGRVVATDISERALAFARANARLNGLEERIEFRRGDLFEPVAGERFDLILANPPFVITPRGGEGDAAGERYEYRDGGMRGDELVAKVVREAPMHLAPGGSLVCLANWEAPWGGDGLDRVREWVAAAEARCGAGLDAWIIERDRVDPVQYAETWARDGGARPGDPAFDELVADWLDDFASRRVASIGLGAIRLRRLQPGESGVIRTEQAMGGFAPDGPGPALDATFAAAAKAARLDDDEALATQWVASDRVSEEREHRPGAESPRAISLVIDAPIGRRIEVDPLLAAALGASDGELTLGQIAGALAELLEVDERDAGAALVEGFRELAWLGMVRPESR